MAGVSSWTSPLTLALLYSIGSPRSTTLHATTLPPYMYQPTCTSLHVPAYPTTLLPYSATLPCYPTLLPNTLLCIYCTCNFASYCIQVFSQPGLMGFIEYGEWVVKYFYTLRIHVHVHAHTCMYMYMYTRLVDLHLYMYFSVYVSTVACTCTCRYMYMYIRTIFIPQGSLYF